VDRKALCTDAIHGRADQFHQQPADGRDARRHHREYGSHNEVNAEGYVSGSIAEGLLGRLSVATEQGASGSATATPVSVWATGTRSRGEASWNGSRRTSST